MSDYKRSYQEGGSYFFTVNLHNRKSQLLVQQIDLLRSVFVRVKNKKPFCINACVVLPDHLHCIWTLPEQDSDYSGRWRAIKTMFRNALKSESVSTSRLWQPRFWEHTIRSENDFIAHFNYIHINPQKHGHVKCVKDWPYSSFHNYVLKGVYSSDWGGEGELLVQTDVGERDC